MTFWWKCVNFIYKSDLQTLDSSREAESEEIITADKSKTEKVRTGGAEITASAGGGGGGETGEKISRGRNTLQSWNILKIQLLMTPMYLSHTTWCLRGRKQRDRKRENCEWTEQRGAVSLMTNCCCEIWAKRVNEEIVCPLGVVVVRGGLCFFLWISLC